MIQTTSTIISNEQIAQDSWRMAFTAPQIASEIKPGQFVHIKITQSNDFLLRRPFSVSRLINLNNGNMGLDVIYKVVGRGTRFMTSLRPGDELDIIGPLGHGFELNNTKMTHILLAGGIGAACLFMLAEVISRAVDRDNLELYILLGAETQKALILQKEFATLGARTLISTDDGTHGYKGSVTKMLRDALANSKISADCAIYACGPEPMYQALVPICREYNIPAQISLERHMMCGFGSCYTCICKVDKHNVPKYRELKSSHIQMSNDKDFGYALVCKDGPVFNIDEVRFDE